MKIMSAVGFADKRKITKEEWLAERKKGIGGSDAAGIVGLNPYVSGLSLWADKTGQVPPKADNEAMRQGRELEPIVARRFDEWYRTNKIESEQRADTNSGATHQKITKQCNFMLQNPKYPHMLADVDRLIVGEKAGLECKTTNMLNLKRFANGEYPAEYYVQCVHYMAVTGADKWYLAVLILNQDFKVYEINRAEVQEDIDTLIVAEKEFWDTYIVGDNVPPADGKNASSDTLKSLYPFDEREDEIELSSVSRTSLDSLGEIKAQIKALEQEQAKHENLIKQEMGLHSVGCVGDYKISYKAQERKTFDKNLAIATLAQAIPDINTQDFYKISTNRVLRITNTTNKENNNNGQ